MKQNYVVWEDKDVPNSFVLDKLSHVDNTWELTEGIPRAKGWPFGVTQSVDPDFPNDILLIDAFRSPERRIIISQAFKNFFVSKEVKQVEYLPVAIIDHKGKPAGDYFILHPVFPVECLDIESSEAEWDILDDTTLHAIKRIVIDESKVDPKLQIFKIKFLYDLIIVRRDLAESITANKFSGVEWTELSDFSRS